MYNIRNRMSCRITTLSFIVRLEYLGKYTLLQKPFDHANVLNYWDA